MRNDPRGATRGKVNLQITRDAEPMARLGRLIDSVPAPAFRRILKVFETGHALESYRRRAEHGCLSNLFPPRQPVLAARLAGRRGRARNRFLERASPTLTSASPTACL